MDRRLLPVLLLALVASPAFAESTHNQYYMKTAAEWTSLGTPGVYLGIDTTNSCVFQGDGSTAFGSLDCLPFAGGGAADVFLLDASHGLDIDASASSVTTTWTPASGDGYRLKATVTSCSGLTISEPSGTVGSGDVPRVLEVTNSCGGDLPVTFSGYTSPTGVLTADVIPDGAYNEYPIRTLDTGTNWLLPGIALDFAALTAIGTANGSDLVDCQDVSATPDVHRKCTLQEIADLASSGSIDETSLVTVGRTITSSDEIVAADDGKTITCNSGSNITFDLDTDGMTHAEGDKTFIVNKGAGDCTVQDGTTADVTIRVKSGFTATFSQYGGGTIWWLGDAEAIVVGGDPS